MPSGCAGYGIVLCHEKAVLIQHHYRTIRFVTMQAVDVVIFVLRSRHQLSDALCTHQVSRHMADPFLRVPSQSVFGTRMHERQAYVCHTGCRKAATPHFFWWTESCEGSVSNGPATIHPVTPNLLR